MTAIHHQQLGSSVRLYFAFRLITTVRHFSVSSFERINKTVDKSWQMRFKINKKNKTIYTNTWSNVWVLCNSQLISWELSAFFCHYCEQSTPMNKSTQSLCRSYDELNRILNWPLCKLDAYVYRSENHYVHNNIANIFFCGCYC